MRIVALADTHCFHADLKVPDGDVLIHAGDLCQEGSLEELEGVAEWLDGLPHTHKVAIAGNHDFAFQDFPQEARALLSRVSRLTYLQDQAASVAGLQVYGSPWQPEFGGWAFNLPEGRPLAERWALIPGGLDVLVTHGPPRDLCDVTRHNIPAGCRALRERVGVVRPRLHLFGHIHEARGWEREGETLFVNVSNAECEYPATTIDRLADGSFKVVGQVR